MNRLTATAIVLLSVSWLPGCDKTSSTTSSAATFTVVPATATAVQSSGRTFTIPARDTNHTDRILEYPWQTSFKVTITETVGIGRDITGISVKVQQASGGVVISPTGLDVEYYEFDPPQISSKRIDAKGSTTVTFDKVYYWLPNGGRSALVTVTFSFTDDNDSSFSEQTQVPVE